MGVYKHIRKMWKKPSRELRQKTIGWAGQSVVKRIDKPTRLDRARSLGYKSKQGFVLARVRIVKGRRRRPSPRKGRKPRSSGVFFTPKMNKKAIAERRVARKFPNLEVLNSYLVGETGVYEFYEVILVDPKSPSIIKDKDVSILNQRNRAFRGLTSAGKRSRGI
ncbi:50S ribosomal protein L15e [archaeon]|nr:50S ribosomal protein L15e [archaeon]